MNKEPEYVYVVSGVTGEYSDWRTWMVVAFETNEEAENYVKKLNECVANAETRKRRLDTDPAPRLSIEETDKIEDALLNSGLDPTAYVEYTGVSYHVRRLQKLHAGELPIGKP
jgi:hypothetical protein